MYVGHDCFVSMDKLDIEDFEIRIKARHLFDRATDIDVNAYRDSEEDDGYVRIVAPQAVYEIFSSCLGFLQERPHPFASSVQRTMVSNLQ